MSTESNNTFTSQLVNRPFLYSNGCELQYINANTVGILPGLVRDSENKYDMVLNEPLTLNFGLFGPNDVGPNKIDRNLTDITSVPEGGWFAIYLIGNSLNRVPIASVAVPCFAPFESYGPNVPLPRKVFFASGTGFSTQRLVGFVNFATTDSLLQIRNFDMYSRGMNNRYIQWKIAVVIGEPNGTVGGATFAFERFAGALNNATVPNATSSTYKMLVNPQAAGNLRVGLISSAVDPATIDSAIVSPDDYPFVVDVGETGNGGAHSYGNQELKTVYDEAAGQYGIGSYKNVAVTGTPPVLYVVGNAFTI